MSDARSVECPRLAMFLSVVLAMGGHHDQTAAAEWTRFGGANGDFTTVAEVDAPTASIFLKWRSEVGAGLSSIICDRDNVYVSYLTDDAKSEGVTALRKTDGQVVWKYEWSVEQLADQEAFGGKPRAPQATPLLHDGQLIVIGFTGKLHCLDQRTGRLLWKKDLVDEFEAVPVQFGFSASPIVHEGALIVLTGGKKGGLVAMDFETGRTRWHVSCEEASYATPVVLKVDDSKQLVFVTRLDVIGVDAESGAELWRYEQPNPGQTNVPTPLPVGNRLVVSGQGFDGTRELIIRHEENKKWTVEEGWQQSVQFFYCNWMLDGNLILGCNGDMLVALDAETGERLGRWRGFRDANIVRMGDQFVIADGNGKVSLAERTSVGLEVHSKYDVFHERCWTPPTVDGRYLWHRGGNQLVCLTFGNESAGKEKASTAIESLPVTKNLLPIKVAGANNKAVDLDSRPSDDYVDQIVEKFRSSGSEAAWSEYQSIRKARGNDLSLEDRMELAELAQEQGLAEFRTQILTQAIADFKDDDSIARLKDLLAKPTLEPSIEKHTSENGLVYIELGVKNSSFKFLNTVVRGPKQHPFSYGIPFPPGKKRVEKWPVGTKLYSSDREVPEELLFTVRESDFGKTIKIPDVDRK